MSSKVKGTEGIEFPDGSVQGSAAFSQSAFSAKRTTLQSITGGVDTVVVFNTELFDYGNGYNPSTGRFQPSVAGVYQVNALAQLATDGVLTSSSISLIKNGSDNVGASGSGNVTLTQHVSTLVYLNGTTDYLEVITNIVATVNAYVWGRLTLPAIFSASFVRGA